LAKRAKDLVRRWRDMVLPATQPTQVDASPALNGAKEVALRNLKPQSPALRGLKPHSPLLKDTTPLRVSFFERNRSLSGKYDRYRQKYIFIKNI